MTSETWKPYFESLKGQVKPSADKRMKTYYPTYVNYQVDNGYFSYKGDTQWQYYCRFINSILRAIRSGECDYCFHIYQIIDLLRYEHERLVCDWLPENKCFKVYLQK